MRYSHKKKLLCIRFISDAANELGFQVLAEESRSLNSIIEPIGVR